MCILGGMMRGVLLLLLVVLVSCGGMEYRAGGAPDSLARLVTLLDGTADIRQRWQLAGDFFAARQAAGTLLVEADALHFFVWNENPAAALSLVGSFNLWRPGENRFTRLAGTPLLHASIPWHPYASFRYLLAEGAVWRTDPLCRDTERDEAGQRFSFYSPLRETWPAWAWPPGRQPRGSCSIHSLTSRQFRDTRQFLLYTASGAAASRPWRLLVVAEQVKPGLLPVYANMFDNLAAAGGLADLAVVVLPVRDQELPPRGTDYLDMIKQELSPLLEKAGWPLAGAHRRLLLMDRRGAGFLLLSQLKDSGFLHGGIAVSPDLAPYEGLLRYYARLQRPGFLRNFSLVWAGEGRDSTPEYLASGLRRQGINRLETVVLPPAGGAAPDQDVARLEQYLRLAVRHLALF